MDVLARLSAEHETLGAHLARIHAAAAVHNDEALAVAIGHASTALAAGLDAHIAQEEDDIFGVITEVLGEGLVSPFREEHTEIRALRDEVLGAVERGRAPHAAALTLCELILDHQQREDRMLFPSAREAIPASRLDG